MPPALPIRISMIWLGVMFSLSMGPKMSYPQATSEYQVKAAYVYNFAKFVEWPALAFSSATDPVRLCVLNDKSFESDLKQIVNGKTIANRPISIISVQIDDGLRLCHILFIPALQGAQAKHIIGVLQGASVLTVGESEGFCEAGGIISFVVQEGHVRFQVNQKSAIEANLLISSRLLSVAMLVVDR
jgi:YfiR/HmsC-like